MAKGKGAAEHGHMKGHGKKTVRGPRKTKGGKPHGKKPSNYNARGVNSKMYSGK